MNSLGSFSSDCQSSIDPPRYAVWLSKANHTYRLALRSEVLAVHLLGEDHRALARTFGALTGDDVDKFELVDVVSGPNGVPLLEACPRRLVGRRVTLLDEGGDHVCVVLAPMHLDDGPTGAPLRLSAVEDVEPGHAAEERPAERSG